jgi:hypothetical protein
MTVLQICQHVHTLFDYPENIHTTDIHQLMQESCLDPSAVSWANARGVAQWTDPFTADMQEWFGHVLKKHTGDNTIDPYNPAHQILLK